MERLIIKKNSESDTIIISDSIFDIKYNEFLIHQLITSYISNSHKGVKKQKSRGIVRGGGRKPWKQKGTGRARVGSIRSPLWKGGGKIFAAKGLEKINKKINKKMYKLGMKIIFSELFRNKKMHIIEEFEINKIKTKKFIEEISHLNLRFLTLFIFEDINSIISLSARNIKNIMIATCKKLNPIILLKPRTVFITVQAIKYIEENLK